LIAQANVGKTMGAAIAAPFFFVRQLRTSGDIKNDKKVSRRAAEIAEIGKGISAGASLEGRTLLSPQGFLAAEAAQRVQRLI